MRIAWYTCIVWYTCIDWYTWRPRSLELALWDSRLCVIRYFTVCHDRAILRYHSVWSIQIWITWLPCWVTSRVDLYSQPWRSVLAVSTHQVLWLTWILEMLAVCTVLRRQSVELSTQRMNCGYSSASKRRWYHVQAKRGWVKEGSGTTHPHTDEMDVITVDIQLSIMDRYYLQVVPPVPLATYWSAALVATGLHY